MENKYLEILKMINTNNWKIKRHSYCGHDGGGYCYEIYNGDDRIIEFDYGNYSCLGRDENEFVATLLETLREYKRDQEVNTLKDFIRVLDRKVDGK